MAYTERRAACGVHGVGEMANEGRAAGAQGDTAKPLERLFRLVRGSVSRFVSRLDMTTCSRPFDSCSYPPAWRESVPPSVKVKDLKRGYATYGEQRGRR